MSAGGTWQEERSLIPPDSTRSIVVKEKEVRFATTSPSEGAAGRDSPSEVGDALQPAGQEDANAKKKKKVVVLKPRGRVQNEAPAPSAAAPAALQSNEAATADLPPHEQLLKKQSGSMPEDLHGLLASLQERQCELEAKLDKWMRQQNSGVQRQDQLLSDLLGHLTTKATLSVEERRHISDTRRRLLPMGQTVPAAQAQGGRAQLPRAASDSVMMRKSESLRALETREEEHFSDKRKDTDEARSGRQVSWGGLHAETVEFAASSDSEGEASTVSNQSLSRSSHTDSKGSKKPGQVAQIKTIRCSVQREEAFSELRRKQMTESFRGKPKGSRQIVMQKITAAVHSPGFEWCALGFVIVSALSVGLEVDHATDPTSTTPMSLAMLKHLTTIFFFTEIALKLLVEGRAFFGAEIGWHLLEIFTVAAGLAEFVIDCISGFSGDVHLLAVVRIGRTLRLLRIYRLIQQVQALRMIYHSMLATTRSLFWAISMLSIVIYCFAIVFQQVVNDFNQSSPDEMPENLNKFFPSIGRTGLTLMQACTGGLGWQQVEMVLADIHWIWVVIFGLYFCLVYFALMNVVTAVFCSSAVERANQDQEAAIQEELQKASQYTENLRTLFAAMDSDRDGNVSIVEFEERFDDPRVKALFSSMNIDEDKAWKLFEILDMDCTGDISPEEFVSQGLRMKGSAQRIDVERTYAAIKRQTLHMEELSFQMQDLRQMCADLAEAHGRGRSVKAQSL